MVKDARTMMVDLLLRPISLGTNGAQDMQWQCFMGDAMAKRMIPKCSSYHLEPDVFGTWAVPDSGRPETRRSKGKSGRFGSLTFSNVESAAAGIIISITDRMSLNKKIFNSRSHCP